jgi:Tc5 transposase DNA-binding domain
MAKSTATGHNPSARPTKTQSPTVSDDENYPTLDDLPKSVKLANAHVEYLDPLNKKTVRALAKEYGVGRTALQDRVNGKSKPRDEEDANRMRLTILEELALVKWCHQLEAWGFPPRVESLRRMAIDMLLDKEDLIPLGLNWQGAFLQRHPELKSKFIPPLDKERAMAQDVDVFTRYFAFSGRLSMSTIFILQIYTIWMKRDLCRM